MQSACTTKGSSSSRDGGTNGTAGGPSAGGAATFTIGVTTSSLIPTVGIVTFTVDRPIDSAVIDFGRDASNFEFQAPVDLDQPDHRTLLLGMKQATTYALRIVAQGGGQTYVSDLATVKTGYLRNGLPLFTISDTKAAALYAGGAFTINCTGSAMAVIPDAAPTAHDAFIFDKDGDLVWALDLTATAVSGCSRARMSYDGQWMWAGNLANVSQAGALYRITMDGLGTAQSWSLPGRSHDFAILPSGHTLFFTQDNGGGYSPGMKEGPDSIKELDPDTGAVTTIYDETTDFAALIDGSVGAHTNQVNYVPALQAISFSMRYISTIGLISYPAGTLLGTFGGAQSDFAPMSWEIQHGHEILGDHLWVFSNGQMGTAHVLGFSYDLANKTATRTLDYDAGLSCPVMGDVKELPNGNLWVTYSVVGVFQEITPTGTLLRQVTATSPVGYSEHRATLYGAPPPYDM